MKSESADKVRKIDKAFTERLAVCADLAGSAAKLAQKSGISKPMIGDYLSGKSEPSRSRLIKIAEASKVSLTWLATGEEPLAVANEAKIVDRSHLAMLPVLDVQASAGAGRVVTEEKTLGFISFDAAYLRSLNLAIADLFTMQGVGESMEPTLRSGEFLLCSKSEHHVQPGDGIFVIRLEGDILVKRLQRLPGRKIKVSSDNDALYEPYVVELNDGTDFVILGKVLFVHGLRRL